MIDKSGDHNPFKAPQTDRVETDVAEDPTDAAGLLSDDVIPSALRRTYGWMFFMASVLALFGATSLVQTWTGQQFVSSLDARGEFVSDSYRMIIRSKLVYAVLYFLSAAFLARAALSTYRASIFGSSDVLEEAIDRQRQFWTYAGIMTIGALIILFGLILYQYVEP